MRDNPNGYYEGHMAVAHHNGEWVLRAAIPQDRPLAESQEAQAAMAHWRERNKAKFSRLKDEQP